MAVAILFLILVGNSWMETNGLRCKCDVCPNSTCETDGLCFTSASKVPSEPDKIHYSYRYVSLVVVVVCVVLEPSVDIPRGTSNVT